MSIEVSEMFLFIIGIMVGAFVLLAISILLFIIATQRKQKRETERNVLSSTLGNYMVEVNRLLSLYRLGDLEYILFERDIREVLANMDESLNEHLSVVDLAYATLLNRYLEDRKEMLLIIRQEHEKKQMRGSGNVDMSFLPGFPPVSAEVSEDVTGNTNDAMSTFELQMQDVVHWQEPEKEVANVLPALSSDLLSPVESTATMAHQVFDSAPVPEIDEFADFASAMTDSLSLVALSDSFSSAASTVTQSYQVFDPASAPETDTVTNSASAITEPVGQSHGFFHDTVSPTIPAMSSYRTCDVEATQEFRVENLASIRLDDEIETNEDKMLTGDDMAKSLDALFR